MWIVETLGAEVDAELGALPADMRAHFVRIAGLIESLGLERVGGPHIDHIEGPLWEIRIKGSIRNKRAILLVFLSVRGVAERVTYPGQRPFPLLADKQKSCAI